MPGAEVAGELALESVAERHVPGSGIVQVQSLRQGLVNATYRVLRDGKAYALRVAVANHQDLGLDRHWEARVLERAVAAELAPALVYYDPERGILISRWAEGHSWTSEDARRPVNLSRMAELTRRIHDLALPVPARVMTPGRWIDYYSAAGAQTTRAAMLRATAAERLRELAALPGVEPVVCHSDLHALNLIDRGGSLVLLDWEYAHAADPLWDLAGWSSNNDFDDELAFQLLADYAGRTQTREQRSRLRLLSWLYDYVCLLWSELYLSSSSGRSGAALSDAVPDQAARSESALGEVYARAELLAARLQASK